MTGFSADWLILREPADTRSRSGQLIAACSNYLRAVAAKKASNARPLRITDLGAGTGASLRAVAPILEAKQAWRLLDQDRELLEVARRSSEANSAAPEIDVEIVVADLNKTPGPWTEPPDLVTCSALFDLTSPSWITALVQRLTADRVALLAMLTYDGQLEIAPSHSFDAAMVAAFNSHQRTDKGFGSAAGPDAANVLQEALRATGYHCTVRDTPWRLERPRDGELMSAVFKGWAGAALEARPDCRTDIADWCRVRCEKAETLLVGHKDIFATPKGLAE